MVTHTEPIKCGPNVNYCPLIAATVTQGSTYTLLVSVYNTSYNKTFTVPFDFYATGDVVFGQYTGRTPIDTMKSHYLSSNLGIDVDPIFVGGTLRIDEQNQIHIEDFTLSDMTTNTIDANGNHVTFNGTFSNSAGNHGVIAIEDQANTGATVTLSGINTHTGSTIIRNGGTLLVSQDANLGDSSASLIFENGTLQVTDSFRTNRNIILESTGELHLPTSVALLHDGTLSGSGNLNKEGEGTLFLDGHSNNTGDININAGTLIVGSNNIIGTTAQVGGNVNLGNTTTLGGHGTILGQVTANAGSKVAPGSSLGTLTVGSIAFNSGSTYEADAYPDGSSDLITSLGNATIETGASLSVLAGAGTWNDSTTYTIIDTAAGLTGTFDDLNTNMAFLTPTLQSNGNQLYLTLTRNSTEFTETGATPNQKGTGYGVNNFGSGNEIYDTIVSMDYTSANNAFDNLSGEIHASTKSAILNNSQYVRSAVNRHLTGNNISGMGKTLDNGTDVWIHSWVHDGYLKDDGNAAKLDNKGGGVLFGYDAYKNETTSIGLAIGYEQSKLKIGSTRNSQADVDAIHFLAYGQAKAGPIDIKGGLGYSRQSIDTTRHVGVGSIISRNTADYNGGLIQVFAEGSHTFAINEKIELAPYLGIDYQRIKTDSFTEKSDNTAGSPSVLHQNGSSDHLVTSTLGVRSKFSLSQASSLYADLAWKHSFGDRKPESKLNFIGGNQFVIYGNETNSNAAIIGLGASIELKSNIHFTIGYEGIFGNQSRDHGGTAQLNIDF